MEKYSDTLPKKYMAAGVLLFNEKNELLILHPQYKDRWEIPGGIVEKDESPKAACIREIKEEIGLDIPVQNMLCVDYSVNFEGYENLQFIFDGGALTEEQIAQIQLGENEIKSMEFIPTSSEENLKWILSRDRLGPRLVQALRARQQKTAYYLEKGE